MVLIRGLRNGSKVSEDEIDKLLYDKDSENTKRSTELPVGIFKG